MFKNKKLSWSMKLSLSILPVVIVLIFVFFMLTSRSIISLTNSNMSLYNANCLDELSSMTDNVVSELNIYKKVIESNFYTDEELTRFISTTYLANDAYPMGIYIGDDTGFYADASGWVPDGEDWVLVERPWYVVGKDSKDFVFGEPYFDSMLGTPCISASARLNHDGAVRVMTADIYLEPVQELVSDVADHTSVDGAIFVTKEKQLVIADSQKNMTCEELSSGDELHRKISDMLNDGKSGQSQIKVDGTTYYVNIKQMEGTGWCLVTYVKKTTVLGYLYKIELIMAVVAVIVSVILTLITNFFAGKMSIMQKKAKTDVLTGILNREGFEDVVKASIEEKPEQGALVVIDMDNFKSVNDTLGHPVGDKVLIEFAELLDNFFNRKYDAAARIGGDEFAVFIGENIDYESLEKAITRFMNSVKEHYMKEYAEFNLSSSIGAAFVKKEHRYFDLYRLADKALYDVKRSGKNGFRIGTADKQA